MSARRLAVIESASEMGGVEFSTLYLVSQLDKTKWIPRVVCPGEGKMASACRAAGVEVQIVPMPRLFSTSFRVGKSDARLPNPLAWLTNLYFILVASNRLRVFLARQKTDLAVTKGMYAHFCGGLAARLAGVKCVWHVQDFISERFGGIYRALFGFMARLLPDQIAVDGGAIARQLPLRIQSRVSVVFNGIDLQTFRPGLDGQGWRAQFGISPGELVIGHAARITPWKGQWYLLEAFGKIAPRYSNVRLLLVGAPIFDSDLYERRLRARVDELGLSQRVTFAGFRADLADALSAMDIFVYPSLEKDTTPLALLSAMGCGLPVAAFDIEGAREALDDAGILVPVGDAEKLAEALEKLVGDASLRKRLAERSRARAVRHFGLEKYAAEMESVFLRGLA